MFLRNRKIGEILKNVGYERIFLYRNLSKRQYIIGKKECNDFHNDGVVCLRNVFDEYWLDLCKKGVIKNMKSPSIYCDWLLDGDGKGLYFNDYCNVDRIAEYREYVFNSPVADLAKQLLKSKKIALFHEHVFFKEQGSTREAPWHHDQAYYPMDGMQNCSIWMPTSFVPKEESLKFIRGSHKLEKYFVPKLFKDNANYKLSSGGKMEEQFFDIDTLIQNLNSKDILQWELKAGDCLVFHMKTVHGTKANFSNKERTVISTRWIGDDMIYVRRPWKTSPPKELLPKNLKLDDVMYDNGRISVSPTERCLICRENAQFFNVNVK